MQKKKKMNFICFLKKADHFNYKTQFWKLFSDDAFNLSSIIKMKTNIKRWINVTWESMDIHNDVFYPQNSNELA